MQILEINRFKRIEFFRTEEIITKYQIIYIFNNIKNKFTIETFDSEIKPLSDKKLIAILKKSLKVK
jgi:hypothetical protein